MNKQQISNILKISEGEKYEYDTSKTWVDLFIEKVKTNPNSFISDADSSITYAELNRRTDIIAIQLLNSGVKAGDFVAIKLPRVKEFLVSVIGIWKTGAAYLPLDPLYPNNRISYMLEDSNASFIIDESYIRSLSFEKEIASTQINLSKASAIAAILAR